MSTKQTQLTPDSERLFLRLAEDAANWNGTPIVDISPSERGNLTDLKMKDLLTTFEYEPGLCFAQFSEKGKAYAQDKYEIEIVDEL